MSKVLGVLVSGRGSNLQAVLDAIAQGEIAARIGVVISDNPSAYALERAKKYNIPTVIVERSAYPNKAAFEQAIMEVLNENKIELVLLAGFMRILSSAFVKTYHGRIMNIHPALLPAFPGLHAQAQALAYGVKVSGCTVHFVDEGMDTGPIILQAAVPVMPDDTEDLLAERILEQEHRIYPQAVKLYCEERIIIKERRVIILDK